MMTGEPGSIQTAILERRDLPRLLPAWRDLAARCAEDNVYYAPDYAMALLETVDAKAKFTVLTVWRDNTLIGFLPLTATTLPWPGGHAWRTIYTFSSTPLFDKDQIIEAALATLTALASLRRGEWIIPNIDVDGPVHGALSAALRRRGAPFAHINGFERASLSVGESFEAHMKSHVASKFRRELARNRRRLEERGSVTFTSHVTGPGLAKAINDFLRIEAAGWKGKRGTAMACSAASRGFALRAFNGACRADVLSFDGAPIAVGLTVFAGTTGFTVKNAYDEAYASVSAGLLLELEVMRSFLTERWAEKLDSGTNGKHVIDKLWPGRIHVADLVFSLSPAGARTRLSAYRATARAAADAKALAKRILKRG